MAVLSFRFILPALAALATLDSATALADEDPGAQRSAIQRPKYQLGHELSVGIGIMPLDAFQKGLTGHLSYTVHFQNYVSWEVLRIQAAYLTSTSLRNELLNSFAVPPADFAAPRFTLTTGVELTPLYGKMVLLNDATVHQAFFLGVHGGVIFGGRQTLADTIKDVRPAVGLGIGYRVFFSRTISLRLDVRNYFSFNRAIESNERFEVSDVLDLTAGLSFNLFGEDA